MAVMAPKKKKSASAGNPWPARLLAIRESRDLTQTEAAEKVGAVLRTWQNWEYGRLTFVLARGIGRTFTTGDVPPEAVRNILSA